MDCLTYRRLKLASPHSSDAEAVAHANDCDDCAAFTRQLEAFEQDLHRAASIDVPEGLAEQIILRNRQPRWFERKLLALAATVVLSFAAVLGYNVVSERDELAGDLIAHVIAEPEVLSARGSIEQVRFSEALADYGARLEQPIGEVRYLGDCLMNGIRAKHILVQTAHGEATLLLIPERSVSLSKPVSRNGYSTVIMPLRKGSLGIVTETPELATQLEGLIRKHVNLRS